MFGCECLWRLLVNKLSWELSWWGLLHQVCFSPLPLSSLMMEPIDEMVKYPSHIVICVFRETVRYSCMAEVVFKSSPIASIVTWMIGSGRGMDHVSNCAPTHLVWGTRNNNQQHRCRFMSSTMIASQTNSQATNENRPSRQCGSMVPAAAVRCVRVVGLMGDVWWCFAWCATSFDVCLT
jgi:hypothetical protein